MTETETSMWNLEPYDISWGDEYLHYTPGRLPGPDGEACIFLRSPTPVEKRRTLQACQTCRKRKAKCSGARPSCSRCAERSLPCTYGPDSRARRAREKRTRSARTLAHPYARDNARELTQPSQLDYWESSMQHYNLSDTVPKLEDDELHTLLSTPLMFHKDADLPPLNFAYGSTAEYHTLAAMQIDALYGSDMGYEHSLASGSRTTPSSAHTPTPLQHSYPLPTFTMSQLGSRELASTAGSSSTIDPRVLQRPASSMTITTSGYSSELSSGSGLQLQ
ncbi:hypothetical protein K474DRAFT_164233 [Panus rudis PR-1116 ss-1]|nr:hypothetical protein K474DRAFT_164233 [Panus rudis PR-1116 ss-1]